MTKRIGREPRGAGRVSGAVHKVSASPNALTGLSSVDDAGTQAWSPSAPGFEYIGCATFCDGLRLPSQRYYAANYLNCGRQYANLTKPLICVLTVERTRAQPRGLSALQPKLRLQWQKRIMLQNNTIAYMHAVLCIMRIFDESGCGAMCLR